MYGNINPTKQQIERENRAKKKKSIIEKDVSSDRNINLLKDKLKNIVDKKRKEEGRKKMVKNLSEFFGKPPSGGKRKTRRKKRRKTRKTRGKKGANYRGRVIFLDFNIEKMKESGIIPEIYGYADNLNVLHKYRVIEDNGIVLKLMHINDKEYKGLKLPISFVKNGTVTIQIITKKMGGRRSRKNKRIKKRRVRKRKSRKKRRKIK